MTQASTAPGAVALQIVAEKQRLPQLGLAELAQADRLADPGGWAALLDAGADAQEAMLAKLAARSAGPAPPERQSIWAAGEAVVCRTADVHHLPPYGAVIDSQGQVFRATMGGAPDSIDHLAAAPSIARCGDGLAFAPPADAPRLAAASVFVAWGGGFNYGHFLLDCLAALETVSCAGLLARFPPLSPPLKPWSRDLLRLAFGALHVEETSAQVVRLDQAVFSTSMDHFLHAPNDMILRVRDRILARTPRAYSSARRIYLSRRNPANSMRVMINEAELEAALRARGFLIVRPEAMPVTEQVILMRDAEVLVGASGAALANALFLPQGAKVFEIQPQNFPSAWVPALCELTGAEWFIYHPRSPAPDSETPWLRRIRRGFKFGYRVELADFLAFLDERL